MTLKLLCSFTIVYYFALNSVQAGTDTVTQNYHHSEAPGWDYEWVIRKTWRTDNVWMIREYYAKSNHIYLEASSADDSFKVFEGSFKTYYENGSVMLQGPFLWGKKYGAFKEWDENGNLDNESHFVAGEPHGVQKYYHENGRLASLEEFDHGKFLKATFYSPDSSEQRPATEKELVVWPVYPIDPNVYLNRNTDYPIDARDKNIQGRTITRFIVDTTGLVGNVRVAVSSHPLLDREAMRVVGKMAKWKPYISHNRLKNCILLLPVTFKID